MGRLDQAKPHREARGEETGQLQEILRSQAEEGRRQEALPERQVCLEVQRRAQEVRLLRRMKTLLPRILCWRTSQREHYFAEMSCGLVTLIAPQKTDRRSLSRFNGVP